MNSSTMTTLALPSSTSFPTPVSTTSTISTVTSATTITTPDADRMRMYIIIGAVIGVAAVAVIIATTMILGILILRKKNRKRKESINSTSKSEKSPNRDGYVNALYDSKSRY